MTGTIVGLAAGTRTGTIRAQDGSLLAFSGAAVLGDFDTLAVGHRVSFGVERGALHQTAVCVFHEPAARTAPPGHKPDGPADLRYIGFQPSGNTRKYRFDSQSGGNAVQHGITVDVALLLKHRIGVQEAPALCLRKLRADLKDFPDRQTHHLAEDDMLAFVALRAETAQRKKPKHSFTGRRGAPPPGPSPFRRGT